MEEEEEQEEVVVVVALVVAVVAVVVGVVGRSIGRRSSHFGQSSPRVVIIGMGYANVTTNALGVAPG